MRYPSGALYARIEEGKREYYYPDGTLKTVEQYQNGRLHGEVVLYWPNGILKRRCQFQNGKRTGLDQTWNEAGQLVDEELYATLP